MNFSLERPSRESGSSKLSSGDRRTSIRHSVNVAAKVRLTNPLMGGSEGEGVISESSASGARLHVNYPLAIDEWVYLNLANGEEAVSAPLFPRLSQTGTIKARIVREIAANDAVPETVTNHYAFGISFALDAKSHIAHLFHRLFPWSVALLCLVVIANVIYLKRFNVEYFWYQPLINGYSLIVAFYILSRFFLSLFYRPPQDVGHLPTVTVIIACKNEEDSIGRTIDCIYRSNYPRDRFEVIAVNDGSTDRTLEEMYQARQRNPGLNVINFETNKGKRHGMAAGAEAARGDILVYIDSDSFVRPDTIYNLVQGFADRDVGAVCGHADVQNAEKNALTKMQAVRYYAAFRIIKAAESLVSCVACCSGCLAAYRRDYVMPILGSWLNQKFLGTEATFGDDRSLTNFMLRRYRVLYHSEAICTTIVPERYGVFFRQQLRWKKSWIRESLIASTFIWRKHPVAALFYYLGVIFPLLAPAIVMSALVIPLLGAHPLSYVYMYGALLMAGLYSLVYLVRFRDGVWVYGVLFTLFYMLILVWQTYYALITLRKNHWGTR